MDANLYRILYEVQNNIQWGNDSQGNPPPYSFSDFTQSTDTAYNLAINFLRYYERPASYEQPIRGIQATYWYDYLQNIGPTPPPPPPRVSNSNKWLFARTRKIKIRR
jgi:hypothetical protein